MVVPSLLHQQLDSSASSFPSDSCVKSHNNPGRSNSRRSLFGKHHKLPRDEDDVLVLVPDDAVSVTDTDLSSACDHHHHHNSFASYNSGSVTDSPVRSPRRRSMLLQSMNQSVRRLGGASLRRLSLGGLDHTTTNQQQQLQQQQQHHHNNNNANKHHNATEALMQSIDQQSSDLLSKVRDQANALMGQEAELRNTLPIHTEKARARYQAYQAGGSVTGAVLSMKKLRKLQERHANMVKALDYLKQLQDSVQSHTRLAKKAAARDASHPSSFAMNLSQYSSFQETVDTMLRVQPDEHHHDEETDEELLEQLAQLGQLAQV